MKLKNSSRWVRNPLQGFRMAVVAYLFAYSVRTLLHPFLQANYPTLIFFLAGVAVAYRYGFWASLFCALMSIPTAFYFFVQPFGELDLSLSTSDIFILLFYVISALLCAGFLELLHRERYNSELLARVADSRYRMMIHLDEDRRYHQEEGRRIASTSEPDEAGAARV